MISFVKLLYYVIISKNLWLKVQEIFHVFCHIITTILQLKLC